MALATGSRVGPYEIRSHLGEGGMGVVYRAHDIKLGRDVAIKALPDAFANDGDRLQRFQREAQVLASLNHPNIAQIYGLEESDKTQCIVMELVDGETLQERLKRGPIPVDEALPIAQQIAEALEAAHEKGVIHRDLKPANIKRTPDGQIKVLDFGLARVFGGDGSSDTNFSNSPTMVSATGAGVLLGTAAYMSPEQARGRDANSRADIYAFGVVLYELLTGHQAFQGETVSDLLAAVLKSEPDWDALPATTPEPVRVLLRQCLQKDQRRRLQHIGDARMFLDGTLTSREAALHAAVYPSRSRERYVWVLVTAVLFVALAVLAVQRFQQKAEDNGAVRFRLFPPEKSDFPSRASISVSPDGRKLAFVAVDPATFRSTLWIRPLDSANMQPLAGTEGAAAPFWSPDSRSIGFFTQSQIKRVEWTGGAPQTICDLPPGGFTGASWNRDGVIIFGVGVIQRVSATGGIPSPITELDQSRHDNSHQNPQFLPDGQHFVFSVFPPGALFFGSLQSKQTQLLVPTSAAFVMKYSAGHLLFLRDTTLMALPFDADKLRATGDPVAVADDVGISASASEKGVLAYLPDAVNKFQLTWFDRSGKELGTEPVTGSVQAPNLSRDGKHVALEISAQRKPDIWILDLQRGTNMRVTSDGDAARPIFSPDGGRVVFVRGENIYVKSASGTGDEERLEAGEPTDWSPDGEHILFIRGGDLWSLSMKDRGTSLVASGKGNDRRGRFSPDGKWFAYESDESGRFEIYVQKFPPSGERVQVSAHGGNSAWWRNDGKELYFDAVDHKLMSVDVRPGNTFEASPPRVLFEIPGTVNNGRFISTLDGQRFLIPLQRQGESQPMTVILNWASLLKK